MRYRRPLEVRSEANRCAAVGGQSMRGGRRSIDARRSEANRCAAVEGNGRATSFAAGPARIEAAAERRLTFGREH